MKTLLLLLASVWLLAGAAVTAADFKKIDPQPAARSGAGEGGFATIEEMAAEFERPDSDMGYFASVPKDENGTVHFSQAREHDVSVPYRDDTTAVVIALGENHREGYCAAIYLVSIGKKPESKIEVLMKDCVRRIGTGYSHFQKPEFIKLPQFSKPLLHISHYRGGRRAGDEFDEFFRIDRGKLDPVLAIRTGRYCEAPYSRIRADFVQETKFGVEGGKLVAKTNREITPRDKPVRAEKFETLFPWCRVRGTFVAKDSRKLELRDTPNVGRAR